MIYYLYITWVFSVQVMIFIIAALTYDNDQLFKTAIVAVMLVVFFVSLAILRGAKFLLPLYVVSLSLFVGYIAVFKTVDKRLAEYINIAAVMFGCTIISEVTKRVRKNEFRLSRALADEKKISDELLAQVKRRHELMEIELDLARRIQEQIIPQTSPSQYIASLYKPMRKVGGDFYDFIAFRNSSQIGIFLSDVSGHGVPAAFITSMVKATILQSGERKSDPAELLAYINDLLLNQTGGNFITAFYGIYDPSSRELVYSNAGHNPPYLIDGDEISLIHDSVSPLLAVFPNDHIKNGGKQYVNNRRIIPEGSRLLFYTDGLAEARPAGSATLFEDSLMESFLRKSFHLPCAEFIEQLWVELVRFRESEFFEDDICVICLDVE